LKDLKIALKGINWPVRVGVRASSPPGGPQKAKPTPGPQLPIYATENGPVSHFPFLKHLMSIMNHYIGIKYTKI